MSMSRAVRRRGRCVVGGLGPGGLWAGGLGAGGLGADGLGAGGLGADGQHGSDFGMEPAYALDTSECGRSPNYWSTTALEWWCFELQYNRQLQRGNCTGFAVCQPLKHGQPCEPAKHSQWALNSIDNQ